MGVGIYCIILNKNKIKMQTIGNQIIWNSNAEKLQHFANLETYKKLWCDISTKLKNVENQPDIIKIIELYDSIFGEIHSMKCHDIIDAITHDLTQRTTPLDSYLHIRLSTITPPNLYKYFDGLWWDAQKLIGKSEDINTN
jgi:hypothetical protein